MLGLEPHYRLRIFLATGQPLPTRFSMLGEGSFTGRGPWSSFYWAGQCSFPRELLATEGPHDGQ